MCKRHTWYVWGSSLVSINLNNGFSSARWRGTIRISDDLLTYFLWIIFNEMWIKIAKMYKIFTMCMYTTYKKMEHLESPVEALILAFWFAGNSLAPTTKSNSDFNAILICIVMDEKLILCHVSFYVTSPKISKPKWQTGLTQGTVCCHLCHD